MTQGTAVTFRRIALLLLPPLVVGVLRRLRAPRGAAPEHLDAPVANVDLPASSDANGSVTPPPEWEMVADTADVWTAHDGWLHGSILQMQLDKWPDFLRSVEGTKALGQSHEAAAGTAANYSTHNTIMSFGYALGRVAERRESACVLDWGGGLGHYYCYACALFPDLKLDYVVKDFPGFCEAGRKLLPGAKFLSDESEVLSRSYDFVFASGSLHYTRDFYGLLERLCGCAADWLMITRAPIVEHHDDFVVVQRPYIYGYMTEYPGWVVNRRRLIEFVTARGFRLERLFLVAEEANIPNAPELARDCGFLFRRTTADRRP